MKYKTHHFLAGKVLFSFLLLLGLLTGISSECVAQENFIPGRITSKEGIQKEGFIKNFKSESTPHEIHFKATPNGSIRILGPKDIQGFSIEGVPFESAIAIFETSSLNLEYLSSNDTLNFSTDTVFLRAVIEGPKSLYVHTTLSRSSFYIKEGNQYTLLQYKEYRKGSRIKNVAIYKNQLIQYFGFCEGIVPRVNKTSYNETSLVGIFRWYYKCAGLDFPGVQKYEFTKTRPTIILGVAGSRPDFWNSGNIGTAANTKFKNSFRFTGGIGLESIPQKKLSRIGFNHELIFTAFQSKGILENIYSETYTETFTYTVEAAHIKINNMARYRLYFPFGNLMLNAGITNAFLLWDRQSLYYERFANGYLNSDTRGGINALRRWSWGGNAGIGYELGKFRIETRYEVLPRVDARYGSYNEGIFRTIFLGSFRF